MIKNLWKHRANPHRINKSHKSIHTPTCGCGEQEEVEYDSQRRATYVRCPVCGVKLDKRRSYGEVKDSVRESGRKSERRDDLVRPEVLERDRPHGEDNDPNDG